MGKTNCVLHGRNDVPRGACAEYEACSLQVAAGGVAMCERLLGWEERGEAKPEIISSRKTIPYLELLEIIEDDIGGRVTAPVLAERMDVAPGTASKWLIHMAKRDMIRRAGKEGNAFVYRVAEAFGG